MRPSVFGPVPSRRLGRSLGVNNLPRKICTYSCVYCQAGPTELKTVERRKFFELEELRRAVEGALRESGDVDYVTFVPDGEPTLDALLGREVELIKREWGCRAAVITNASLLWRNDVREDLLEADYVSVKVDCAEESLWRRMNRPHESLYLNAVLEGIKIFAEEYRGTLTAEVMLVKEVNCSKEHAEKLAKVLKELKRLDKVYVAVPVRPPTEPWVKPPPLHEVASFAQELVAALGPQRVSMLLELEEGAFGRSTTDPLEALAGILEVHPLELGRLRMVAESYGVDWRVLLRKALELGVAELVEYQGREFLVKKRRG